jgi:hypothetical protein
MLPTKTLPASWLGLLGPFRSCFTAPTFTTFVMLVSGLVARPRARTVTGMLIGAQLSSQWHHCRAHRFFSRAVWSLDEVSRVLTALIVRLLLPADTAVLVAVDDTLFTRSGRRIARTGWHHDASSKTRDGKAQIRWGHCWVVAGLVVTLPLLNRPVCLPVAFALWQHIPGSTAAAQSKQALAGRLITLIAAACPGRDIDVVADCWYAGADGAPGAATGASKHRGLPAGATLTSRLRSNTALTWIATPTSGRRRGRPKRIGTPIGTPKQLADHHDTVWNTATVHRYGRIDTVTLADTTCLWYGVYRSRPIRVIQLRDDNLTSGYDLALITTDLTTPAEQIIERYAARWSIEVAFADAKQNTGVGEARNRTRLAVERTVPITLITQSLIMLWHSQHGTDTAHARRTEAPWYRTKTRPAYLDMIVQLRRTMIATKILEHTHDQPTPQQTHAVLQAWEQAAA